MDNISFDLVKDMPKAGKPYTVKDVLSWTSIPAKFPWQNERTGMLIVGQTETGKTSTGRKIVKKARQRKEPALIHDPHGDFITPFYDESMGDVVLNPRDVRYTRRWGQEGKGGWSFFNDLKTKDDIKTFLRPLFPILPGVDPTWANGPLRIATGVFWSIINKETERPNWLPGKIIGEGTRAIKDYCKEYDPELCNTILADPDSDKNGLPGFMMALELAFEPFRELPDGPFSLREWIKDRDGSMIFMTNRADKAEALLPIYTAFIELFAVLILSQEPDDTRRTWLILDEVFALGKMNAITSLPAQCRKFGLCIVAITQNFVQGFIRYSEDEMDVIVDNLANWIFFRANSDRTTEKMSKIIGQAETKTRTRGDQTGTKESKAGASLNDKEGVEYVVLPSEIAELRLFECFFRIKGHRICHAIFVPDHFPKVAEFLIEAPERPAPEGSKGPYTDYAKKKAEKEAEKAKKEAEEAAKKAEAEKAKNEAGGDQQPAQESAANGGLFDPADFGSSQVNPTAKSFLDSLQDFK